MADPKNGFGSDASDTTELKEMFCGHNCVKQPIKWPNKTGDCLLKFNIVTEMPNVAIKEIMALNSSTS